MLDRDLAQLYGVETKQLVRQVKRNIDRFEGEDFMFELTNSECNSLNISLRYQIGTSNKGGNRYGFLVFTELGIAMLSSVLRSDTAININRNIMRAFVTMRNYVSTVSTVSTELAEFKERLHLIEQSCRDNADAVSDLSEDMQKELYEIYLALSQLADKQKV